MAARLTTYLVAAIVVTTFIAGLIVGAQRDDNDGPVDLIVHNARIYTADRDGTRAEAVAIRGNQILQVGSEREIMRLRRPQTSVIDAAGATVLPGFNDAHAHMIEGGLRLTRVALDDAETVEGIQDRLRLWAAANPDSAWIVGHGWHARQMAPGQPTRQHLDAVVAERPVVLVSQDGQSFWLNSAALEATGITRRTADPAGGAIIRDQTTGEPTGVLRGTATALVSARIPRPTREERARALRAAVAEAHANGITSIQNASSDPEDLALFEEARRSGELTVRVYSALTLDKPFTNADRAQLLNTRRQYPDDAVFKPGAVKILLDGTIEAQTAALLAPYANAATDGETSMTADDLNRTVRLIDAEGWQVMVHASGDRAVRLALDAYQHAVRSNGSPERDRRHRVEHAAVVDARDLPRFDLLDVVASVQPAAGLPSRERLSTWVRQLGPGRMSNVWAFAGLARENARLAFGSDWPANPLDPMLGLHVAVTGTAPDGMPEGGWDRERLLALEDAIDAYTSGAAWASFDEQRKGTITPGMLADLVILSEDIFESPAANLARTRVKMTIFDGQVVYRRDRGTD